MDEHRVPEDGRQVAAAAGFAAARRQFRHVDLVDQVAEEGRLGQPLDVGEIRGRLDRDGGQDLAPVEPAGRVDIDDGDGEQQPPGEHDEPAARRPTADDVVGPVDRLQERGEVGGGPAVDGRRDEDQGRGCRLDVAQRSRPAETAQQRDDAPADLGGPRRVVADHHHVDGRIGQGLASGVQVKGVQIGVEGVGGHPSRWSPQRIAAQTSGRMRYVVPTATTPAATQIDASRANAARR